ncbi:MAG: response regulator [Myxococcota bacterium]
MKVLIVDDSKVMRLMVARTLRQAGFEFELIEAENGVKGLEVYQRDSPHLVLADWNMPEMTGMELLVALRKVDPRVRLGFVTSEQTPAAREAATEAGALFLIAKPFTPEDFKNRIGPAMHLA